MTDEDKIEVPDTIVEIDSAPSIDIDIKMGVDEIVNAVLSETETVEAVFENPVFINNRNYEELNGKPSINGVELQGNKSLEDLNVKHMTNLEIENILQRAFSK